jgi:hypothetical protein
VQTGPLCSNTTTSGVTAVMRSNKVPNIVSTNTAYRCMHTPGRKYSEPRSRGSPGEHLCHNAWVVQARDGQPQV